MSNLSVRSKLAVGFAIPVIGIIFFAIVNVTTTTHTLSDFSEVADRNLPMVAALEELKFEASRTISSTNETMLDKTLGLEEQELEDVQESIEAYHSALNTYRTLVNEKSPEDRELLSGVETAGQELLDSSTVFLATLEDNASLEEVAERRAEFEEAEKRFIAAIDVAIEKEYEDLQKNKDNVQGHVNLTRFLAILKSLIVGSLALGAGYYLYHSVVDRLRKLQATANKLRSGELSARSEIKSTDELGQFAATFNAMAERLGQMIVSLENQVAETAKARDEAERSNQVKSAFLASMSHELRTPLNAVINFTKFVAKGDLGPINEQQEETLNEVIDSARHLLNLINDVLDMSKIESGSLRLFVDDNVDMNAILDSVVSTGKSLLGDKPVELQTELDPKLPRVRGDRQRILQILLNIMSNACKFTDEGFVKLQAYPLNGDVVVAIEDSGPGIAPEDQAAVFEPFKQTRSGLRKGGGTGLGMPISKSLTEAHGGRLWLSSEVGKGSTFFVAIPIKAEHLMPTLTTQGEKG